MSNLWTIWALVFAVVNIALTSSVTIHAVLWKRDSRAVIGWVALAWLAPIVGACAYWWLGVNRIKRKAVSFKDLGTCHAKRNFEFKAEDQEQRDSLALKHPNMVGLAEVGRKLTCCPAAPGNKVEPLVDGDQAYPAMLKAISKAKHSVSLLSYIFDCDRVGNEFLEALVEAQKRNVQIRVLIDDVGSKYSHPNMVNCLKEAGLNAASFLPTRVPRLPLYANLRNHRKILVVDGKVGFTGGTNIRDDHCLKMKTKHPVQCLHFQLDGPVVAQLQKVFAIDWAFVSGETLSGEDWFPTINRAGQVFARGIEHGPDEHFEKMADTMAAALASARHQVRIVTPYFLPNASLIHALNITALRGVAVDICLPSTNNIALVQWAATAQLWQLLEKGCRIYYTPPPFDHTKLMIVDNIWALIGSTNWDPRSLRLNFEFNVECYDEPLAQSLNGIVDKKLQSAHEVTLDDVNGRSFPIRLRDGLARLLTPYL